MARLSEQGLRKTVGVPGLFATAYGNVGSSIYYALGLVAAHALGLTPLVFVFAGGLFALTAKTYAEGASMFPEAGGSSSFARHAFNEVVSFFAGWALSLDYILTIAISAFFVPHYLSAFPGLGALNHNPDDIFGGLIVVGLLAALNIRGLGESAKLNFVLAVVDLSTQVLLVVIGAVLVLHPSLLIHQVHLGTAPSWHELIFAISLAMLAYTGIETVANMAEESRDPGRQVPRAVNLVLLAVLGVYLGISLIALSALPVLHHAAGYSPALHEHFTKAGYATELGGFFQNDPVLGIISRLGLHGTLLKLAQYYVGLLAATILFIATNAGMIGISRLSWSLSEHRQLPRIFSALHARYRTPWFTILFFSGLAGLLVLYGNTEVLGNLYSFGALLSFTTAHVAIIALRRKEPDRERPYRMPWNVRIRGSSIPLSAVLGGIGTATVWVVVIATHSEARIVGIPWMVLGMGGYFLYRRRQGLDPFKQYRLPRPERPPDFQELEYRTALVPIFGDDVSASALSSAAKLIGRD
ncbi:MAG: APC family permease, partial [Solirubrobacteraceae bacterium]